MTFYKSAVCRKMRVGGCYPQSPLIVASGWVLPLRNGAGLPALPFAALCPLGLATQPGQAT